MRDVLHAVLDTEPAVRVDYAEIVDAATMQPVERIESDTLVALAAFVGSTRLIDNIAITFDGDTAQVRPGPPHRRESRDTMNRIMMKSKIHRATITGADLNYVGSITLDPRLMELADLMEHEQVHVLDIDNGARFETYVIRGGPGDVILNGAAARLVHTRRQGHRDQLRALRRSRARGLRAARRPRRRGQPARRVLSVPDVLDATP